MRKSKARKPAFDVAHVDLDDSHAGWVYRSNASAPVATTSGSSSRIADFEAGPQRSSGRQSVDEPRGWMETGARVLVFPLACAIVAMAAPVLWMLAPRARQ